MPISRDTLTKSLNTLSLPIETELSGVRGAASYETVDWTTYGTVFLNVESVESAITLDTGDQIAVWDSRGDGNSRTLIKSTAGDSRIPPDFNRSGVFNNSVGSVDFDNSQFEALQYGQSLTDWEFIVEGQDSTTFFVINATFDVSDFVILFGNHNNDSISSSFGFRVFKPAGTNTLSTWCNDFATIRYNFTTSAGSFVSGTSYIFAIRIEAGASNEVEIFANGSSIGTSNLNASAPAALSISQFVLGADPDRDANTLNGSIGQLLVYSTALTPTNMTEVFNKLSSNWGIDLD